MLCMQLSSHRHQGIPVKASVWLPFLVTMYNVMIFGFFRTTAAVKDIYSPTYFRGLEVHTSIHDIYSSCI